MEKPQQNPHNLGEPEDWILAGIVDASHRTSGNLFAVGGHVVMLINKRNRAASTIHWESRKIERVVHSSAAAETIALQMMFDTITFVRKAVEQMCGQRAKGMQCVALTDCKSFLRYQLIFHNYRLQITNESQMSDCKFLKSDYDQINISKLLY